MAESEPHHGNAGQWPKYSGFKALQSDRKEIRLIRLEPETSSNSLRYVMHHAELGDKPRYCAVSYAWGAPVPDSALKEIFIHGESVRIRPTLYSFLKILRSHNPGTDLWIDAICIHQGINQGDVEERNNQLSIMGEIYRTAQEVYVWLGIGDDDTNYAIEHIEDKPQTRFDSHIFLACVEKLFGASYWTRRWVIQEFALAQELTIFCGGRLTKWRNLKSKSVNEVLGSDSSARQTFESFKKVESLDSEEKMSLLELMERFQNARCFDPHDKVFALRSIADDGDRLSPHYDESVADLYFRVLSMLPTERVLPAMSGYRWPHQATSQLQKYMQVSRQDLLKSLKGSPNDRLYTVFEYMGLISTVQDSFQNTQGPDSADKFPSFPLKVRLQGSTTILRGQGDLTSGDLVYSLQSTLRSPEGLYIAFRLSRTDSAVVGMLIQEPDSEAMTYWTSMGLYEKTVELIRNIMLKGVFCCRNNSGTLLHRRILCHINRQVLVLLWLLDIRKLDYLWSCQLEILDDSVQVNLLCDCANDKAIEHHEDRSLEILPSFTFEQDQTFWAEEMIPPWTDLDQQPLQQQPEIYKSPRQSKYTVDFRYHKRTGLSYAAEDGLILFTKYFLSGSSVEINFLDNHEKTPIWWAAYNSHEAVVKTLLDAGADVNAGEDDSRALYAASEGGHEAVVKTLLDAGADVNAGEDDTRALYAASEGGHEAVMKTLLDAGADVNAGEDDTRALYAASLRGHKAVVKMLLDAGADVNAGEGYRRALYAASEGGHEAVVKTLLDAGADVNAGGGYRRALYAASEGGHEVVVKTLLDAGADVNARGGYSRALYAASLRGHEAVVKTLLDAGADVNAGEVYRRALYAASKGGHEAMVKTLLDAGADVDAGEDGSRALYAASLGGYKAVVKTLLDAGADVNAREDDRRALCAASEGGHEAVVKMLLDAGADVNAGEDDRRALYAASEGGHETVVKTLLDAGADVNAGEDDRRALYAASEGGHEAVVKTLLDAGADVNAGEGYRRALYAASEGGHEAVVKTLLDAGADVNAGEDDTRALYAASEGGHEAVVKTLLDAGADVNAGEVYRRALYAASKGGHEAIKKMILVAGADVNTNDD